MATHEWAQQVDGLTLMLVRGPALLEIGDALAFRWETERTTTFDQAQEDQMAAPSMVYTVQVDERDGWTVLVAPNGYAEPDTVAQLSRRGTAVSVFWSFSGATGFTLARDGSVARAFDPLLFPLDSEGEPLPEEAGLIFGNPEEPVRQHALTLAERLTGVQLDERWMRNTSRPTWTTRSPRPPAQPGPLTPLIPDTLTPWSAAPETAPER